jgi:hypothetical protein
MTILVVSSQFAGGLVLIGWITSDGNDGNPSRVVDGIETLLEANGRVGYRFRNQDVRQALGVMDKVGGKDGAFVRVGGMDRGMRDPIDVKFVVAQNLRITTIAVDIASTRGVRFTIPVTTAVVNQACFGIPRGGPTANLNTGRVGAMATFLTGFTGRTGAR